MYSKTKRMAWNIHWKHELLVYVWFVEKKLQCSETHFFCMSMDLRDDEIIIFWWANGIIYDVSHILSSLNKVCVLVLYRIRIVLLTLSNGKRFTATPTSASSSQIFFNRTFGFIWSGTTNFVISVFRLELKLKKENSVKHEYLYDFFPTFMTFPQYLFDADVRSWVLLCFSVFNFELLLSLKKYG